MLGALDAYFDTLSADAQPTPIRPAARVAVDVLARLHTLLVGFSGDTVDYFNAMRASLALVLAPPVFEQLALHVSCLQNYFRLKHFYKYHKIWIFIILLQLFL